MHTLIPLVAIVMVFGIPLSAIIGNFWVKAKRLNLEGGGGERVDQRVEQLEADNRDLRQRIEVLETIVTSDTPGHGRVRVAASPEGVREPSDVEVQARAAAARSQRA